MTAEKQAPSKGPAPSEIEALGVFRALIEGRLAVVDRFDRDGRTFLVAVLGSSAAKHARSLSTHELRAASLVRAGHTSKVIAFELGLSESRVSVLLRSMTEKLGARSRVELVRLLASLPELSDVELELSDVEKEEAR